MSQARIGLADASHPAVGSRWFMLVLLTIFLFIVLFSESWRYAPIGLGWLRSTRAFLLTTIGDLNSQWVVILTMTGYLALFCWLEHRWSQPALAGRCKMVFLWMFVIAAGVHYALEYRTAARSMEFITLIGSVTLAQALAAFQLRKIRNGIRLWNIVVNALLFVVCAASIFPEDWEQPGLRYQYRGVMRWTGPLENPNYFGALVGMGFVLSIGLIVKNFAQNHGAALKKHEVSFHAWLYIYCLWIAAIVTGVALFRSLSRGAWLGSVIGVAYIIFYCWKTRRQDERGHSINTPRRGRRASAVVLIVCGVAMTLFWTMRESSSPLLRRFTSMANPNDFSSRNRIASYAGALQMIAARPVTGHGWGMPEPSYHAFYAPRRIPNSHAVGMNDYLVIGIALGLPGLIALFGIVCVSFSEPQEKRSDSEWWDDRWLRAVCRAATLLLLTVFCFEAAFYKLEIAVSFWILLAIVYRREPRRECAQATSVVPEWESPKDCATDALLAPVFASSRAGEKKKQRAVIYLRRSMVAAVWAFLIIPPLQVAGLNIMHPRTTGPIVVRWITSQLGGPRRPPAQYTWLDLKDIPSDFFQCAWVVEDPRFFSHHGFDWPAIGEAWKKANDTGRPPTGASTITMQCARSAFLWQGRSWVRKGFEAYYTILMEMMLNKDQILELYANVVELGDGIYGIEAGSRRHFGKSARELTRSEIATLVALLPAPKQWDPASANPKFRQRYQLIMQRCRRVKLPSTAKT